MNPPLMTTLPQLEGIPGLVHGFLTRHGGVSPAPYDSMNTSVSSGDTEANVRANLELVRERFGFDRLATVYQVHGTDVLLAEEVPVPDGITPQAKADGLITDKPGLGLLLKVADCLGVILVDPEKRAVGAVHAGWRGLMIGAIPAAVRALTRTYGSNPADLRAGISASLGPCCAEFINYKKEFPKKFWAYRQADDLFDLWAVAQDQLTEMGLLPDNIGRVGSCTKCNPDLYFSYRGEKPITGRLGLVAGFLD